MQIRRHQKTSEKQRKAASEGLKAISERLLPLIYPSHERLIERAKIGVFGNAAFRLEVFKVERSSLQL